MHTPMNKKRQDNPFLPGFEISPKQKKEIEESLNSPEGAAVIKDMADHIDAIILDEFRKQIKEGKLK